MQLGADVELPLARRFLELEHDVHVGDRLISAAAIFLQGLEDFTEATFAFALHDVELHVVGNSDDRIRLHVGHAAIQSLVTVTNVNGSCDSKNANYWKIVSLFNENYRY